VTCDFSLILDDKSKEWISRQLSKIFDAFALAAGKISMRSNQTLQLIQNHQGSVSMIKNTLIDHLSHVVLLVTEFASAQVTFSSLMREDQIVLLKNNIPLYLQYIIARYFSAGTGLDQLSWILEGQLSFDSIEIVKGLRKISFPEYNRTVQLFLSSEIADVYSHHINNVGIHYPFPQHCNGLIANMLLYFPDSAVTKELKEPNRIKCIFEHAKELVRTGFERLDRKLEVDVVCNTGPLIQTLTEMKHIFGSCQVTRIHLGSSNAIEVRYTDTEELWLNRQFEKFQSEYLSVAPPSDYFNDLILLLKHGRPTGESFVRSWMGMMTERVRRVLMMHPEFNSLSEREQACLWSNNFKAAVALGSAQANSMRTGKEQLRVILGHIGDSSWEHLYNKAIDLDCLKGSYLNEPEINHGRLDEFKIRSFFEVMNEISMMVSNDHLFQLFVLLTLLDAEGLYHVGQFAEILKLRQMYLKLFQRKLNAMGCSYTDYACFRRTLSKVRKYAALLETFNSV